MSSNIRTVRGNSHVPPEVRRAELIQAAIICFGRKGYYSTTIDHIAKQAGLSKGTVYRFFKSKDDVLLALMKHYEADIDAKLTEALAATDDIREQLKLHQRIPVVYISQMPEMLKVWREFLGHTQGLEEYAQVMHAAKNNFSVLLRKGIDAGVFIDQPVDDVVDLLFALHEGLFDITLTEKEFDVVERFDACWNVLKKAIICP